MVNPLFTSSEGGVIDISADTSLPETFTYTEARSTGISERHLYQLRDQGAVEQIGHGLFHRATAEWTAGIDLIEIAAQALRPPCA